MYKAIHAQTGEEIVILNPTWRKRIPALRELDHAGLLLCQGCRQPLRVKAGEVKRPHFAHKHLKACSYGSESPEILNARAVLYGWLLKQFGQSAGSGAGRVVTVEKQIESGGMPRPVDCWVENEAGIFAYWIIESGIKLEPREAILAAFERLGVKVNYVFLQAMLNEKKEELHSLLLTPTERAFLQPTEYDRVFSGAAEPGNSLYYLDADLATLTTYRNLTLFHAPNWYKGVKKTGRLETIKADRGSGEFVQRGESEMLNAFRQKSRRLEAKRIRYQQREADWESRLEALKPRLGNGGWSAHPGGSSSGSPGEESGEPLPCAICGQITTDYWSTFLDDSGRKLCRCRECLEREL